MLSWFLCFQSPIFLWSLLFSRLSSLVFCYHFTNVWILDFTKLLSLGIPELWRVYSSVSDHSREDRGRARCEKCFLGEWLSSVSFATWKVEMFSRERSFDLENFQGLFRFQVSGFVPHHCLSLEKGREKYVDCWVCFLPGTLLVPCMN